MHKVKDKVIREVAKVDKDMVRSRIQGQLMPVVTIVLVVGSCLFGRCWMMIRWWWKSRCKR